MSDSRHVYAQKVQDMFDRVNRRHDLTVRTWISLLSRRILADTPGPGNQYPPDTEYIATGRLRGGWMISVAPPEMETGRYHGGPYDISIDGEETADAIETQVSSMQLAPMVYLWNDVAYGYIVHEGLGRHHFPRPFVTLNAQLSTPMLREAEQMVAASAD